MRKGGGKERTGGEGKSVTWTLPAASTPCLCMYHPPSFFLTSSRSAATSGETCAPAPAPDPVPEAAAPPPVGRVSAVSKMSISAWSRQVR